MNDASAMGSRAAAATAAVAVAVAAQPKAPSSQPKVASAAFPSTGTFANAALHGQRGITVTAYTDPSFAAKANSFLDHVAALGVNSLNMMVWFKQTSYTSSDPQVASYSATPQQMQILVTGAHQRGMSVMIRPIMDDGNIISDTGGAQWRGTVLPTNPDAWFSTYYNSIVSPYATLSGVDAIDIGSELATLADKQPSRWLWIISSLRSSVPSLRLTYSSTDWIALPGQQQPYPSFATSLDLLGVDAFFPLNGVTNGYLTSQLVQAWQAPLARVAQLSGYYHKPVVFTELGVASQCCTLTQPFVFRSGAAPDLLAQQQYYAAACQAIRPYHIGLYWWDYDGLDPLANPASDNGFSPYGKPAEQEMARCYLGGY